MDTAIGAGGPINQVNIPGSESFITMIPILKGFSRDKKYYIETADHRRLLLRVADIAEYDRKKDEFEMMERVAALDVPMSRPVRFGVCDDMKSVYQLFIWCDGEELGSILPTLPEEEQYALGIKAGEILKKIHTLETYPPSSEWAERHGRMVDRYIDEYRSSGVTFEGDGICIDYVEKRRGLLENRPMCLSHGDFHAGNLIFSPDGELSVIDFNRYGISDPYAAFRGMMFSAAISPRFATGQVHGYFGGEPPADFWGLFAFYMAAINLHALPWSVSKGQEELDFAYKMISNVLSWFADFTVPVPSWYTVPGT